MNNEVIYVDQATGKFLFQERNVGSVPAIGDRVLSFKTELITGEVASRRVEYRPNLEIWTIRLFTKSIDERRR